MAMNGRFEVAAIGIFCAAVLDSLDGRVARMTNTQSAFGEQMDSLCDMVSFGAAPALIVYEWALKGLGKLGWIAAFVYIAGAALRLARFNTNIGVVDKRFFQGLPSPAAAALVMGFIWVMDDAGFRERASRSLAGLDRLRRHAVRRPDDGDQRALLQLQGRRLRCAACRSSSWWRSRWASSIVSQDPPMVLFALFCVYGLSGYGVYGWRKLQGPAGQRDRDLDRRARRGRACTAERALRATLPRHDRSAIALLLLGVPRAR